jgi:hypothetical protein
MFEEEGLTDHEKEPSCGRPCPPNNACDECADYWHRMRAEGLWEDGKGWTDKAMRAWP